MTSSSENFKSLVCQLVEQLHHKPPRELERADFEVKGWCRSEKELRREVVDTAVCFANAEGGILLVGPDDTKTIDFTPSCHHGGVTPEWLAEEIRKFSHPPVDCTAVWLRELVDSLPAPVGRCVVINVPKKGILGKHTTHAGVCLVRHKDTCEVDYLAHEDDYSSIPFEAVPLDCLAQESLSWAFHNTVVRPRTHARWRSLHRSVNDLLADFNLVSLREPGKDCITLAALLLFGKSKILERHTDGTFLRITVVDPAGPLREPYTYTCQQNIIDSLRDLWTHQGTIWECLGGSAPERCLQELVVNALIHRDYRISGPINTRLVPAGSLEIQNPGGFLRNLGPHNLINGNPVHRNRLLN